MIDRQKGFSLVFIIIIVSIIILVGLGYIGYIYYNNLSGKASSAYSPHPQLTTEVNLENYNSYPESIKKYFPLKVSDLNLVQIEKADYNGGCRGISVNTEQLEKICLIDAYRGFYAYPNSDYLVKMHVDMSNPSDFERDLALIQKEEEFLSSPEGGSLNLVNSDYKNINYISVDRKQLGEGQIVGNAVVIVPQSNTIITMYFTNQGLKGKINSLDQYLSLKENFIHQIIDSINQ